MKRVILLTGASSGIGASTAKALSSSQHIVVMLARNEEKMKSIAANLECPYHIIKADVTDVEGIKSAIDEIIDKFGGLDVLINNAGLGCFDPIEKGKLEEWHTMVDVNIKGLLNCTHSALPHLMKSENGQIINLASVAAHHVFPNSGVYCATKHAVLAISTALHQEVGDRVRVATISPGAVNTPFIEQTTNEEMLPDMRDYFSRGLDPDVIAQQIVYCIETPPDVTINEIIVRPRRISKS